MTKQSPAFINKIKALLANSPAALEFLFSYASYIEMADDLVDEPFDKLRVQQLTALACHTFSLPYWRHHADTLRMVEYINNITYFDSVALEQSDDKYKKKIGRILSHCGYNMLYAVLILVLGFDKTRSLSMEIREIGHQHLLYDEAGKVTVPKDSPLCSQ